MGQSMISEAEGVATDRVTLTDRIELLSRGFLLPRAADAQARWLDRTSSAEKPTPYGGICRHVRTLIGFRKLCQNSRR